MTKEELNSKFSLVAATFSKFFLELEKFIDEEVKKKETGEECNEYIVEHADEARMHASHSLGELIEAKSCILEDLSPIDKICLMQYEKEMSTALESFHKERELDDIFNDGDE